MKPIASLFGSHDIDLSFESWYAAYPKKAYPKRAKALWEKLSDEKKKLAIVDVPARHKSHSQWKDKQYIPAPDVYLRNEKWCDDIIQERTVEQEQYELEDGSNLDRFWTLLKQTYGNERIKRQYGEKMPFMWKKYLDGLTKKQIAKIINHLMNDADTRLPDLTRIIRIRNIGRHDNYKSLPRPRADKELALRELNKLKGLLR